MNRQGKDIAQFGAVVLILLALNFLGNEFYVRFDLTEDQRYSLKPLTTDIVQKAPGTYHYEIFLDGNISADYKRMRTMVKEKLNDLRMKTGRKITYSFTNPDNMTPEKRKKLDSLGVIGVSDISNKVTELTAKLVYPGAIVTHPVSDTSTMEYSLPTNFVTPSRFSDPHSRFLKGLNELEYALTAPIAIYSQPKRKTVAFVYNHGELKMETMKESLIYLSRFYSIRPLNLMAISEIKDVDALIIAQPRTAFADAEKYKIDHYLNQGGNVLMFFDPVQTRMDTLGFMGLGNEFNIRDLLFTYGIRVNQDLIQDKKCVNLLVNIGSDSVPNYSEEPWQFDPILQGFADHPITNGLNGILAREVSTLDTLNNSGIRKTPLVFTSTQSRSFDAPRIFPYSEIRYDFSQQNYKGKMPVCYLLEGQFPSHYAMRPRPPLTRPLKYDENPKEGKFLVFSDGNILKPQIDTRKKLLPLGYDRVSRMTFDNKSFLKRAVDHMLDQPMIEDLRTSNVQYRPLNKDKVNEEKEKWQLINLVVPPLIPIVLFSLIPFVVRTIRRKSSSTES